MLSGRPEGERELGNIVTHHSRIHSSRKTRIKDDAIWESKFR